MLTRVSPEVILEILVIEAELAGAEVLNDNNSLLEVKACALGVKVAVAVGVAVAVEVWVTVAVAVVVGVAVGLVARQRKATRLEEFVVTPRKQLFAVMTALLPFLRVIVDFPEALTAGAIQRTTTFEVF